MDSLYSFWDLKTVIQEKRLRIGKYVRGVLAYHHYIFQSIVKNLRSILFPEYYSLYAHICTLCTVYTVYIKNVLNAAYICDIWIFFYIQVHYILQ